MTSDARVDVVASVPLAFANLVVEISPRAIALSGGDTARRCYEQLAAARPDWNEVDVYLGDERWVDVTDPESNEGMARTALLDHVRPRHVHSVRHAGDSPHAAAARYDAHLREVAALGVVHLGLGDDAHTASLFPGSPALDEVDRLVVATGDAVHPRERVTFTFPAIARADLVIFTVEGADKRDAFARVQRGEDVPAGRVHAREVRWLVDQAVVADGR